MRTTAPPLLPVFRSHLQGELLAATLLAPNREESLTDLARRLAADARVDVLMHRFNMAHRKAAREVFPAAAKARR